MSTSTLVPDTAQAPEPQLAPESPSTIDRLRTPAMGDGLTSWLVTVGLALLALVIRLPYLDFPKKLVFDEVYYAKDAWTLSRFGYERDWQKKANDVLNAGGYDAASSGQADAMLQGPAFVVHPPLGKHLIAIGEQIFGLNSLGWRFMALIFGCLLVAATVRLARRLTRSTLIAGVAGFLLCVDGLHFVMSRIALLDIFQAFFIVAGVACMMADRDWFRDRLADYLSTHNLVDLGGERGPLMLWRPWRLAAGVLFGCGVAVKWNTLFPLALFCLLTLAWDLSARRLAGAGARSWWGLFLDGVPAFCWQVIVAALVYVATWWRWFTTKDGWDRQFGADNPQDKLVKALGPDLGSFVKYHIDIYAFHTGDYIKNATHPYDAHPAGWLIMARPIGIDAQNNIKAGTQGCPPGGDNCMRVISAMGTPLLWWLGAAALIAALVWWIGGRDWRFSVPVLGVASTWIPWFFSADRPVFFFYAICIVPFTCIALAMAMGVILGPADGRRRATGAVLVGTALALIVANFAFIYPVLSDRLIPHWQWQLRMWLGSWI